MSRTLRKRTLKNILSSCEPSVGGNLGKYFFEIAVSICLGIFVLRHYLSGRLRKQKGFTFPSRVYEQALFTERTCKPNISAASAWAPGSFLSNLLLVPESRTAHRLLCVCHFSKKIFKKKRKAILFITKNCTTLALEMKENRNISCFRMVVRLVILSVGITLHSGYW